MATVTNTIQTEISHLTSGNELYDTYHPRWRYFLESYLGGETYRSAKHLTRYQLESDGEYQARLNNTPLDNHCYSVVSIYKSFLFRQPPTRDFGSIKDISELEDFLKDSDLDGRSLDAFMKDATTWASVFGHSWVVITQPDVGATTRESQRLQGVRPYLNLLTPLTVLDWEYTRSPNGRYELSYFKYLEEVNTSVRVVKEWTREVIKTSIVNIEASEINEAYEEPNNLGKIPAVCLYNIRSTVRGIGISDIADIADLQRFNYNAISEVDQSIRLNTHPSLVATPECNLGSGAGALIHMPENLDPGLKPYMLEYTGASVESIYKAIDQTVEAIDKIANTGSIRSTEARRMSGVAQEQEFELLNARLSEKADAVELAEEQIWKCWCYYMGYDWSGTVDYPGSFNIKDTQSQIQQLKMARETATNPLVLKEIDKQILEWMEVDQAKIDAIGIVVASSGSAINVDNQ
tara:strand:+ start:450 stop:1838 length:1389 start_codon:yes stop_codon:yes gene_type:complete